MWSRPGEAFCGRSWCTFSCISYSFSLPEIGQCFVVVVVGRAVNFQGFSEPCLEVFLSATGKPDFFRPEKPRKEKVEFQHFEFELDQGH